MRSTTFAVVLMVTVLACLSMTSPAGAGDKDATDAVYKLFEAMELHTTVNQTIIQMVDLQVQSNPQIAPFRKTMLKFFEKYMGYANVKNDMAKLYTENFTTTEIRQMTNFYLTPVGKKMARLIPMVRAKGAAIGQKRVKDNMGELQVMIKTEMERLKGASLP